MRLPQYLIKPNPPLLKNRLKFFPISRFIVSDRSMEPTFYEGDHILTFNWGEVKTGDVIVFKKVDKNYIKRIRKTDSKTFIVSGDNIKLSRSLIIVEKSEVIGRILMKY